MQIAPYKALFVAQYGISRHNEDKMPKQVPQNELDAVLQAVARFPEGGSIEDISRALEVKPPRRTLQRRLALLVEQKRLTVEGRGRGRRYRLPVIHLHVEEHIVLDDVVPEGRVEVYVPISPEAKVIKQAVREPIQNRHPVGYNRAFLDAYRPNVTSYLAAETRQHLLALGRSPDSVRPAGTY